MAGACTRELTESCGALHSTCSTTELKWHGGALLSALEGIHGDVGRLLAGSNA